MSASAHASSWFALCLAVSLPCLFLGIQSPSVRTADEARGDGAHLKTFVVEADGKSQDTGLLAHPQIQQDTEETSMEEGFGEKEEGSGGQKKKVQEDRKRSSHRRRRGTMDAEFGGDAHDNSEVEKWRPEVVKSSRCDGTGCHACHHKSDDGCWHGTGVGTHGDMSITVSPSNSFTSFAQEVFLSCADGAATWDVKVHELINAKIFIYVNNELKKEVTENRQAIYPFTFQAGTKARVRTVLVPINKGAQASARAKVEVQGMANSVDVCMSVTNCMTKLGTGSEAGFELRNRNDLQYKCLASGDGSLPSNLQSTCAEWVECLPDQNELILKTLLKVSGAAGSAPLTIASTTTTTTSQARIAVPNNGACDWGLHNAGVQASCVVCNHYYDPRSGYGDNSRGECQYAPDQNRCFPAAHAENKAFKRVTQCSQARIAVPQNGACDWGLRGFGIQASCVACNHYYDPRSEQGFGDNSEGECQYVPAKNRCFAAGWVNQQGFTSQTQCSQASLKEKASTKIHELVSTDPNGCINPAVDDPESWDCECIEDMMNSCGGVDEVCFLGIMCKSAKVCQSWKNEHCNSLIQQSEDAKSAGNLSVGLGQRGQDHHSSAIGDGLDGSLQGKCSQ